MSQPSKRCPACGSVNFIHARVCACGHQFTTRFPGDPGDITTSVTAPVQSAQVTSPQQPAPQSSAASVPSAPRAHPPGARTHASPGSQIPIAPPDPIFAVKQVKVSGTIMTPGLHSVVLVAAASAVLPPLGAILNRQYAKSFAAAAVCFGAWQLHYVAYATIWAACVVDAIYTAQRHYRGEFVRPWECY